MSDPTIEKEVCKECGVEARENTQFCYNCGTPRTDLDSEQHDPAPLTKDESDTNESLNGAVSEAGTNAALDELTNKLKADELGNGEKLAQAAEKRRKARVVRRQPKQYTWEPAEELSAVTVMVLSLVIAMITAVIVLITIFWK